MHSAVGLLPDYLPGHEKLESSETRRRLVDFSVKKVQKDRPVSASPW
jgi:hypothetical protein